MLLSRLFRQRYLESLSYYRWFYDDLDTYGPADAERAFYFVPGFNGVPGQIRYVFPSLMRLLGNRIHIKCLSVPAFASHRPIWDKYSTDNVDTKRSAIIADLGRLLANHSQVTVLCSSSGFYDFLGAMNEWSDAAAERRLRLAWAPCAPDRFFPSPWESLLFPLNGLVENGFRWFAYPNNWVLRWANPEIPPRHRWSHERQTRVLYKPDIESRFVVFGMLWDYLSIGCFGTMIQHMLSFVRRRLDIETHVLVAKDDGFWQGRSVDEIDATLNRYLTNFQATYKASSHLWALTPDHFTEAMSPLAKSLEADADVAEDGADEIMSAGAAGRYGS